MTTFHRLAATGAALFVIAGSALAAVPANAVDATFPPTAVNDQYVAGQSVSRDHKADKDARDPISPVAGAKQRECLKFLADGVLWVSYYSSHEGKTSIYLARVKLPAKEVH